MKRSHLWTLMIASLIAAGPVALAEGEDVVQVVFDHAVEVRLPSAEGLGAPVAYEAAKPVPLAKDKVTWIESKGRVPMLVLPQTVAVKDEVLKVSMPEVNKWPALETMREIDNKLAILTEELVNFQTAIRARNVTEAERVLARMEVVSRQEYLHFLRATVDFLKGDVEAAKASTRKGLNRFPSNEQGRQFLKTLEEKGGTQ